MLFYFIEIFKKELMMFNCNEISFVSVFEEMKWLFSRLICLMCLFVISYYCDVFSWKLIIYILVVNFKMYEV